MLWYQAVEYFSAEEDIEFDNLYPKYEPDFGSSSEIDDFVAALPIAEVKYRHFKDRLAFLDAYPDHIRVVVVVHINRHEKIKSDETVDTETLHQHGWVGFKTNSRSI
ncbi:hypothetical protein PC120_g5751 [Phytophthora cactorum]|nr:hypothetical protein PC120_g5751 [Phytophthora cactorum]